MLLISIQTQFIGDFQASFLATTDFSCQYFDSTMLEATIIDKSIEVSSLVYLTFQVGSIKRNNVTAENKHFASRKKRRFYRDIRSQKVFCCTRNEKPTNHIQMQ